MFVALAEDQALSPSTHMAAHNHVYLQFQSTQHPLLTSVGTRHIYGVHICMYMQTFINKINLKKYSIKMQLQMWIHDVNEYRHTQKFTSKDLALMHCTFIYFMCMSVCLHVCLSIICVPDALKCWELNLGWLRSHLGHLIVYTAFFQTQSECPSGAHSGLTASALPSRLALSFPHPPHP